MPYAKNHLRVNVPKRSGFDKSHRNSGTGYCGTLTPLLCDEVVPNTRVSLRLPISVQLPPLVSETYMNVKYKVEAFFVPMRLLCRSFEDWFCDFPARVVTYPNAASAGSATSAFSNVVARLPVFNFDNTTPASVYSAGSLLDYLGFKKSSIDSQGCSINPLSLVAYHLIWQEWYRNPRIQNPAFVDDLGVIDYTSVGSADKAIRISSLPFTYYHEAFTNANGTYPANYSINADGSNVVTFDCFKCADGVSIFSLRQRNFPLDYFTGARVDAQQGSPVSVAFDGTNATSIASIRAANSLQQFRERNNIPSPRLVDQAKARYGANLADGVAQRPICIGTGSFDVVTRGIDQQGLGSNPSPSTDNSNYFEAIGAQYGRGSVGANEFIIDDFIAQEPGYIMVIGSLVPEVTYTYGSLPHFKRYLSSGSITQMACSLLQNVGDQPIFAEELIDEGNNRASVFGYTDRYADFMFHPNEAHGMMRSTLQNFLLQRAFSSVTFGTQFLEIPKDYLDPVLQVESSTSFLSYWYDAYLQYKVSMPLAEFSIPSLQDPAYEHGSSVVLRRNGQIF